MGKHDEKSAAAMNRAEMDANATKVAIMQQRRAVQEQQARDAAHQARLARIRGL